MGYKAAFYGVVGIMVVALAISWKMDVWSSVGFWSEANKYGLIFTIVGTLFTVGTFYYVGMYGERLKRRHRIPEAHKDLKCLLDELRIGLKDWKGRENDILDILYQIQGLLENVSSKLDGVEKTAANELAASIAREGLLYVFRSKITEQRSWKIQRKLQKFVAQLGAKHLDNEVERL